MNALHVLWIETAVFSAIYISWLIAHLLNALFEELVSHIYHATKCLFDLPDRADQIAKQLDKGKLPEELRESFSDNGVPLEEGAQPKRLDSGDWLIETAAAKFLVQRMLYGVLNIYEVTKTSLPDTYRSYRLLAFENAIGLPITFAIFGILTITLIIVYA